MFALPFDETLSDNCFNEMQKERYEIFKSQDLEKGRFDIVFEIEEKKLHAHSFVLTSVSEYMHALLSERWTNKDEPVKIGTYSYDNFYQFLCFLYTGKCEVTNENVFKLVDMAEFFGVSSFKKFCDKVLTYQLCGEYGEELFTVENVEELTEFAFKYSLKEFVDSIREYFLNWGGIDEMFKSESFLAFKKPFIEFLVSVGRKDDKFFEGMYKWSENKVKKQNDVNDETFNLLEAVKAEMNTILPQIEFSMMSFKFMKDFVVEKGFLLSPAEFKQYFKCRQNRCYTESGLVEFIYELAEKQALQKQKMAPNDENFNTADSIKADLSEVLPIVKFHKINQEFLTDFVEQ
uniref:BTB domain-containing protein n=1 Tax=Panagrolaimus davidi TaxID=227884 RepID=A0A914PG54_9BILA